MNRILFAVYNCFIYLYTLGILIASVFQAKAAAWVEGRKGIFGKIKEAVETVQGDSIAWFHCASLGEFEQGRPVMEAFRKTYPGFRILVTFFSPSGYETRKNYKGADFIFYLPADTAANAKKFIALVNPRIAFFIKYEFWFNYLKELDKKDIPVYSISAVFRNDQHFFSWYGKWARKQLKKIHWFFVQDEESLRLLNMNGISNVTVTGDTRFDRVYAVSMERRSFPAVEKFCSSDKIFIAGSSWPADEKIFYPFIRNLTGPWKFIIAPHEVHADRISSLVRSFPFPVSKYSELNENTAGASKVLVIDSIGILAHLYRFATIAYIGGAFGSGLHNILEAAVFGVPVIFGPGYEKFNEAKELIRLGGAFSVGSAEEFSSLISKLETQPELSRNAGEICRAFVLERKDATRRILEKIHV